MKLWDMFKIVRGEKKKLSLIKIGFQTFYLIEIDNKDEVLIDGLIQKLFSLEIPLYWFKNYYEFETFFSIYRSNTIINFVLIY